jgi:signal transduction histidine kinase
VRFTFDAEHVRLEVSDDGRGFDDTASSAGLGLDGMRARAASIGGQLVVQSTMGLGTTVLVTVPHSQATT